MRRTADGERINVEWSLLEPSGVIGDEGESAETDLAALSQTSACNHDEGDRKNCNFCNKSLRHLTHSVSLAPDRLVCCNCFLHDLYMFL